MPAIAVVLHQNVMRVPTRSHLAGESGFTLTEVVVVVLMVGILAAIALPLFGGQRTRAQDTRAQVMLRTVATALHAHRADEDSFNATRAQLSAIESAIAGASSTLDVSGTENTFTVTETSKSGTTFTLSRAADGDLTRTCSVAGRGLCRADSKW